MEVEVDCVVFFIFFIYLLIATIWDIKKREIPDWISYSLLFFGISYRIFQSFFYSSIIFNLAIVYFLFFILANIFYYSKFFAGGDYKLLISLSPVFCYPPLILKKDFFFLKFLIYVLIVSSIYGLIWSFYILIKNYKKFKFKEEIKESKFLTIVLFSLIFLILSLIFYFIYDHIFFIFSFLIFLIFPFLYIIINFADKMLIIEKNYNEIVEGDILYKDIKIGNKIIKAKWEGLNKEEIKLIKKFKKKVKIKEGIPFVPVFFIAFVLLWFPFF
ncbi:MAG: A24 family peptidase [Candidatus Pacearchaeota archaeon]